MNHDQALMTWATLCYVPGLIVFAYGCYRFGRAVERQRSDERGYWLR